MSPPGVPGTTHRSRRRPGWWSPSDKVADDVEERRRHEDAEQRHAERRPGAWGWDLRPTDARPVASALQHRKGLESLPQDRFRRHSQPPVEQRGVDAAEVDRPFQVAIDQLAEPGRFADQAGLGLRAGEEDRPRRPVIRAKRSVLGGAPAEFAEGQEQHAIGQLGGGQVVQEGADGPAKSPSNCAWVGNCTACVS